MVGLVPLLACTQAQEPGHPLPTESNPVVTEVAHPPARSLMGGTWALADVTGDKLADLLVISSCEAFVLRSDGTRFLPPVSWAEELPCRGLRGSAFADVTGDGLADALSVNDYGDGVVVRRSTGTAFLPNERWSGGVYLGTTGTSFADVTGDGLADALAFDRAGLQVRRSDGASFLPPESWASDPGNDLSLTFFADVTGDGAADAVFRERHSGQWWVAPSTGNALGPREKW